jgi:hypothetical protein
MDKETTGSAAPCALEGCTTITDSPGREKQGRGPYTAG